MLTNKQTKVHMAAQNFLSKINIPIPSEILLMPGCTRCNYIMTQEEFLSYTQAQQLEYAKQGTCNDCQELEARAAEASRIRD